MDPCVKLAREFKRADRAAAYASPKDSAYKDRQRSTAERAADRLVRTPPTTPQGAARLLDYAAWLSGETFGEDTPEVLRQIGRHWRNGRRVVDEFAVLLQIIELVELLPRDTLLSEGAQDDILSLLDNALEFMHRLPIGPRTPMPPLRNLETERQMQ
jgi:hypothetical protein